MIINAHNDAGKKARGMLAAFSAALTGALGVFVWIMLEVTKSSMSDVLLGSLTLVAGVTIVAQVIYAMKGQIFEFDGRLAKNEILFAIISFQLIMQFSFGFSLYAVNQTELQNASFDSAYSFFTELQQSVKSNDLAGYHAIDLTTKLPPCVESVLLVDHNDTSGAEQYFRFPVSGGKLLMKKSSAYFTKCLQDFAISLLMSLVISVLLIAEVVYLAIKIIDSRYESPGNVRGGETSPVGYLRQIAFLFYFTGCLDASFIPIMARDLSGGSPNADFIAGLPYSVEAFASCSAILFATWFFNKKGWKPPYAVGMAVFIAGTLASAYSPNVYLFIASRAVIGTGYGFCWMTLRNLTAISGNRSENFASLSSGIYAGTMCGAAFGSVLADLVGYRSVLLISTAMVAAAAAFPMTLRNETGEADVVQGTKIKLSRQDFFAFAIFLAAIVVPTCIAEAFCGYVLPLYVNDLQLPTAYVGRTLLIYNLFLVYISSTLLIRLVWKLFKNPLYQCASHMLLIALALFAASYLGGFHAMLVASALLGSADGFGFSVQNAYALDMRVSQRLGKARMLTYFSLFKKFGAMLGPVVFGFFIVNGFQGLGVMGIVFIVCLVIGVALITLFSKREGMAI